MANGFPSINDLIKKPTVSKKGVPTDLNSAQFKFTHKMDEIKVKELEVKTEEQAKAANLPYIDLDSFPVSSEALKVIPEEIAREKKIICFYYTQEEIRIGGVEPIASDNDFVYQLGERHHAKILPYLISEHSLERIFKLYANLPIVKPISKDINITDEEDRKSVV